MELRSEQKQFDSTDAAASVPQNNQEYDNPLPHNNEDKNDKNRVCRVCQCLESDRMGDVALGFLNITTPFQEAFGTERIGEKDLVQTPEKYVDTGMKEGKNQGFVEFVGPDGEVFLCSSDIEAGSYCQQDILVDLGCSCKGDLALAHYACALKWFINHGSTICEICGVIARNVRVEDFKKVTKSLKDYETLRERTAAGESTYVNVEMNPGVDPDAVAAIQRQRLSEISLWFNPRNSSAVAFQGPAEQPFALPVENVVQSESLATKWAVEGTGILVATGLLTVTLAWLIAPRVGKKTARNGLHILLGGVCALTIVIFLRFIILSKIKSGPARYWAILFVFWFLVFGIWASRTHGAHTT